ncbi:hypothetical protein PG993_014514 [Apiospora rasikravindrae]|uniref:Uncharacterized protein n=1 Tax=Apiospora rasikravindrae TaxID=990691 RepID=A0ABR1RPC8_9PEZI
MSNNKKQEGARDSSGGHYRHSSSSSGSGSVHSDMPVSSDFLSSLEPARTNFNTPEPAIPSQAQPTSSAVAGASRPAPVPAVSASAATTSQKAPQRPLRPLAPAPGDESLKEVQRWCSKCFKLKPESDYDSKKGPCKSCSTYYCTGCARKGGHNPGS